MNARQIAAEIIKEFEGLRLKPYRDSVGVPTIGYGSTKGISMGMAPITEEQAEKLLIEDMEDAESVVDKVVTVPLNDNQKAALISFVFNVGPGKKGVKDGLVTLKSGKQSTMLTKLNRGDYEGAANEFLKWDKAGGRVLAGLTRRRKKERALFVQAYLKPVTKSRTIKASKLGVGTGLVTTGTGIIAATGPAIPVVQTLAETAQDNSIGILIVIGLIIIGISAYVWYVRKQDYKDRDANA
jgi:lysozyme